MVGKITHIFFDFIFIVILSKTEHPYTLIQTPVAKTIFLLELFFTLKSILKNMLKEAERVVV